jgi:hypothetical protein
MSLDEKELTSGSNRECWVGRKRLSVLGITFFQLRQGLIIDDIIKHSPMIVIDKLVGRICFSIFTYKYL